MNLGQIWNPIPKYKVTLVTGRPIMRRCLVASEILGILAVLGITVLSGLFGFSIRILLSGAAVPGVLLFLALLLRVLEKPRKYEVRTILGDGKDPKPPLVH